MSQHATATTPTSSTTVDPILVDKALMSLRSSGHDPSSAVGEVIDNSLQAGANAINIRFFTEKKTIGKNKKSVSVVERIAIGDDGTGMAPEVLWRSLQLGYSTRYNDRTGMGRFGVGAKLGAISQVMRVEIYSRQKADQPWLWTYIDLEEIGSGKLKYIPQPIAATLPSDCEDIVSSTRGTLVIWSKADRLQEKDSGGARPAESVQSELMNYVARTFRKFLDGGIKIAIEGSLVKPYDPLYLMTTTRFHEGPMPDPTASVLVDEAFDWPVPSDPNRSSPVKVRMTLLPEQFRPEKGSGGAKQARDRRIDENEGVSILRAGREIFFGILRNVQPSPVLDIDRWVGIEIEFSPELDECFAVKNVKKGAEPVNGLRDKLREIVHKTVMTGRNMVRAYWHKQEAEAQRNGGVHAEAMEIASRTMDVSPKPLAGQDTPEAERQEVVRKVAEVLGEGADSERRKEVEELIRRRPVNIVPEAWPGHEMFEIEHLGTTAIVKLNVRHPFYQGVYAPLIRAVEQEAGTEPSNDGSIAKLALIGLDLLLMGYARAEGMHPNPSQHYADIRSYWSIHVKNMMQEWRR